MALAQDKPVRVLLVEDNPADADYTSKLLQKAPNCAFDIHTASDLARAVSFLDRDESDVDAVLLDLNLPDSVGLQTLRALRKAQAAVPIVVLSGVVDEGLRLEVLEAGGNEMISKNESGPLVLSRSILYAVQRHRSELRQRQIEALIARNPEAMLVVDQEGFIQFLNPAASQMLGQDLSEERLVFSSQPSGTTINLLVDGEVRPVGVKVVDIEWQTGRANLVVLHDLHDKLARVEAEGKAMRAESRLELFLDSTTDLVCIFSPEGRIEYVNPAGLALVGWSGKSAVGQPIAKLHSEEEAARILKTCVPHALEHGSCSGEVWFRTSSGELVPTDAVIVVKADESGKPLFAGAVARDIRERTQLENQLRQAQKMEAVGRLAGGVAHDFNNLLTAIFSFSQFVMEGMNESDPAYADMLEIENAAKRAQNLTNQLLSFSRKRTVRPRLVDPNESIREMAKMLARLVGEDVEVTTSVDSPVGIVRIDPSALEQVIVNLVVNARDAMPHGGKVTLESARVSVDADYARYKAASIPTGEYVVLSVSDTGVGMDEEARQHVFEPFFTTKAEGQGTGLGLATVYGIVKQAGGYVWVYSEKGKGTTFRIYLPRIEAAKESLPVTAPRHPKTGTETIVVVEDDPQIRRLSERALKRRGYRVHMTASGDEAVRYCEQHSGAIDLLLTDVVMPGMSGKQVAERLSRSRPQMKVLFMSGYTPDAIVHHGVVDPGVALLQKPFSPDDIATKVRTVLDSHDHLLRDVVARRRSVMVVDNAKVQRELWQQLEGTYDVAIATDSEDALQQIKQHPPDVILCNFDMPHMDGKQLYDSVRAAMPHLANHFVFVTGPARADAADFLRSTGCEVVQQPAEAHEVLAAIARVI